MHGGVTGRQLLPVPAVHVDRGVGDLVEEVRPPVPLQAGRVEGVECALQHGERHVVQADQQRRAVGPDGLEHLVGLAVRSGVAPDDAAAPAAPEVLGERGGGWDGEQRDPAAEFLRERRQQFPVPAHDVGGVGEVVEHRAADDHAGFADVVAAEGEGGDDAEVPAAAAQRPEQVAVRVLVGRHERAVGEHHVGGEKVVYGQPEATGEIADAATEGQPAHTRGREEAGRGGHAEGDRGVVDVAPGASAVDADGVVCRIDRGTAHQGQVDDERVVPHPEAAGVVPAAAHGQGEGVGAAEADAGNDVGGVPAACDRRGVFVDHAVVDGTRRVVAGVAGGDQVAAQGRGQVVVRHGAGRPGRDGGHGSPFRVGRSPVRALYRRP
ncbi:hypothetical protein AIIKEEIJ_01471 [Rhodococcus sp. YH1]|nr:hypothetical protein [Rhodococcus sp. YH1]